MSTTSDVRLSLGDFQTPQGLADRICRLLAARGLRPRSILEPSSGQGNILLSALMAFPHFEIAKGIEIQPNYAKIAEQRIAHAEYSDRASISVNDFFRVNLEELAASLPGPVLIVGNPPWATNARLGSLGSDNVPQKRNLKSLSGLDALTGRANFDIAEWFILQLASAFAKKSATIALLCKTSVARQALTHLWESATTPVSASCYRIDAKRDFAASADACLLVMSFCGDRSHLHSCDVFPDLEAASPESTFGLVDGRLVADLNSYRRHSGLLGSKRTVWRSGLKHDCTAAMELIRVEGGYRNGLGEDVHLEDTYIYPLVKATQLFHRRVTSTDRAVIVPQRRVGEETRSIEHVAPLTWRYLLDHAPLLDARKSSIYRGKPRFSVFGVGDYSFADWKVCISALHKELRFTVVGPTDGRPTMLDDTTYFLSIGGSEAAESVQRLLGSVDAIEFLHSLVFWDAKRPVTSAILGALNISALAAAKGVADPFRGVTPSLIPERPEQQTDMFARRAT